MPGSADTSLPRLHVLVSEREIDAVEALAPVRRLLEEVGPLAIHLRGRWSAARAFEIARRTVEIADAAGGWCVVNGRPDIALAAGAQAVQLGRTALSVADVRRLVRASGGRLSIGASVHAPGEAAAAVSAGADFLVLGTVYSTPSHPGRPGSGPAAISSTVRAVTSDVPVLAIGGIAAERVEDVARSGAYGIVVASAVWKREDPVAAALELRDRLERFASESESHE